VAVRRGSARLGQLWVPPQCPSCHVRICGPGICEDCLSLLEKEPPPFESPLTLASAAAPCAKEIPMRAAGRYEGIWRNLVQSYKATPVQPFPNWLEERFESLGRDGGPDPLLLPVPMHRARRRERGLNPAEILAKGLAAILGWPMDTSVLERVRYRRPLRGLSADVRKREMVGAVRVRSGAAQRIGERAIWMVDDVLTTGSTTDACFQALEKADISGMGVIVLAWAPWAPSDRKSPSPTDLPIL